MATGLSTTGSAATSSIANPGSSRNAASAFSGESGPSTAAGGSAALAHAATEIDNPYATSRILAGCPKVIQFFLVISKVAELTHGWRGNPTDVADGSCLLASSSVINPCFIRG